jgi:hypothetical protein
MLWPLSLHAAARRLFLLDFDRTGIDRFVSLGSPQLAPPDGIVDQVG